MGRMLGALLARGRRIAERLFRGRRARSDRLDPELRREAVLFLRDWLPAPARETYREMILADPEAWHRHPHFQGGVVVRHALRGNGITEAALGVRSLDRIWRELLEEAVLGDSDARVAEGNGAAEEERA